MISYKIRRHDLLVRVSGMAEPIEELTLSVIVDREAVLDQTHIVSADSGWSVQLPQALSDEQAHRIALDITSGERPVERLAFSFAASLRPIDLVAEALGNKP